MTRLSRCTYLVSLSASLFCVASIFAQTPMERLLLPVVIREPLLGAHGSLWVTELVINNHSNLEVKLGGVVNDCPLSAGCTGPAVLPGQATVFPIPLLGGQPPTMFLLVEEGRVRDVDVQLRVRDLSRATLTWGTEVPVIHESRALGGTVGLLDIPRNSTSRLRLRFYDFNPSPAHTLHISGYEIDPTVFLPERALPDPLLFDFVVTFQLPGPDANKPGYWELDLSSIPMPDGIERFRLVIEPSHAEMRYWTFVSITNNETQHITLITPD